MSVTIELAPGSDDVWSPSAYLSNAVRLAETLAGEFDGLPLYLGGAPTAGLGTPMSDVDVFVVGDEAETRQIALDGQRVDVEFISLERLRQDVEDFTAYKCYEEDFSQVVRATEKRLDAIIRFYLGSVIADPQGHLARLHEDVDTGLAELTRLIIARHSVECSNKAEDLQGALLMGDHGSADYLIQQVLLSAAQAVLTSMGDLYMGHKWVWRRWNRTAAQRMPAELNAIVTGRGGAMRVPRDEVADVELYMHAAQDMLVMAQTGIVYTPMIQERLDDSPRRSGWLLPMPVTDGLVLSEPRGMNGVSCSAYGALLWGVAHGRGKAEAIEQFSALIQHEEGVPGREEIAAYYDDLVSNGAIVLPCSVK